MTVEEIRRSHNLTQKEFAKIIGISKRSYYNKVYGVKPWLPAELAVISKYCNEIEIPCGEFSQTLRIMYE